MLAFWSEARGKCLHHPLGKRDKYAQQHTEKGRADGNDAKENDGANEGCNTRGNQAHDQDNDIIQAHGKYGIACIFERRMIWTF
jgi:hypothetical protein